MTTSSASTSASEPPARQAGGLPSVGFVGLGRMGAAMAGNLLATGFRLTVSDVRRESADAAIASGADWAASPAEVARRSDVICLSLPGPAEFRAVLEGAGGLEEGVSPGALVIDFTTNSALVIREAQARLAARGIGLIDAPVSGGVTGARSRRLTVQAGGTPEDVARARPVLEAVADTVLHVGGSGAGSVCKVLHNCAVFCADLAMVECLTAGVRAGVEPDTLIEVFQRSGLGRNHDLQVALPARLFRGRFDPPHFALGTALKDMTLATDLAAAYGVPMALAERCAEEMRAAVARGWAGRDENVFLTLQEERAGVAVRFRRESPVA